MGKTTKYIISKIDEIKEKYPNLEFKFGKSDFYQSYTILINNSEIYNSEEFMDFEGKMIVEFINKFNSEYTLFVTDDEYYFQVDNVIYQNEPFEFLKNDFKIFDEYFQTYKLKKEIKNDFINDFIKHKFETNFSVIDKKLIEIFNVSKNISENRVNKIFATHSPITVVNYKSNIVAGNEEYALAA